MSTFIVLEGMDGSGKSTQAELLRDALEANPSIINSDINGVMLTREPTGSELGNKIKELVYDPDISIAPPAEMLMYLADRCNHYQNFILPHIKQNYIVICDRYSLSTLVHQWGGVALLPLEEKLGIGCPHITLFYKNTPALSMERCEARATGNSKDPKNLEDFVRLDEKYSKEAANYRMYTNAPLYIIDGGRSREEVLHSGLKIIVRHLVYNELIDLAPK